MKKNKALVLLSGGLDSILAAKVLMEQGIEVTGINFESNFFSADKARLAAQQLGIKLIVKNISHEIWRLVKNPPSGHGKNMNPCLDCHALMIKMAGVLTSSQSSTYKGEGDKGYDFLATGEVLGERPFSQNRASLDRVVKLAGVEVLRPLSAKLLPETGVEKLKLVNREKLFDINGRSRARQFKLAKQYGIKEYPSPDGGCLLTDRVFSQRLKELLKNWPDCGEDDIELLKYGRIFWLNLSSSAKASEDKSSFVKASERKKNNVKIIKVLVVIGRHEQDNKVLEKLAKKGDFVLKLKDITGPVSIVRIKNYKLRITNYDCKVKISEEKIKGLADEVFIEDNKLFNSILILVGYYSVKARGKEVNFEIKKI